jgi:hypothetical protein
VLGLLLTIFLAVANRSLKRFVGSAVV